MREATRRHRWATLLGAILSLAMAAGLAHALLGDGLKGLDRAVPADPLFYPVFALSYLALPMGDWWIFRRLWGLPGATGLGATLKKRIANEVVLGYSGEAYFYAWARRRMPDDARPFSAVKDVAILSALAGNGVTLALALAAVPVLRTLLPSGALSPTAVAAGLVGAGVLVATTLPFLFFRRQVFALAPAELRWTFGVHLVRQVAATGLLALGWAIGIPGVAAATWLALAAVRLVVTRLPFLPNKDLLFANVAVLMLGGQAAPVAGLIAFAAALTLATHAALALGFGVHHLARRLQARTAVTR